MARNETRHAAAHGPANDTEHLAGTGARAGRGSSRSPVNPLTVIGTLLVMLGTWSILRALGLIPDAVADAIGSGWAVAAVLAGAWLLWRGRRVFGDVRAPDATSVTPVASVQVRATAVFGDVRLRRA